MENHVEKIQIAIGYDSQETIAYHTLVQSIFEHTSLPVQLQPLLKKQLHFYKRQREITESTDFSLTRFLVPFLNDYQGWTLYCDCDFIFVEDLKNLWNMKDSRYAVMVCKHDYTPSKSKKFLNNNQSAYNKKNWSSLMLFNNAKCRALTPDYINQAKGLDLHQYKWLESEDLIGSLPLEWNYLCEEEYEKTEFKGIHFTNGGPWFFEQQNTEHANLWKNYRKKAMSTDAYMQNFFHLGGEDFERIPYIHKSAGSSSEDYKNLRSLTDGLVYLLKDDRKKTREFEQKYSIIDTQHVGTLVAHYVGLQSQKNKVVTLDNGERALLCLDARSATAIKSMESLAHYSHKLLLETRSLDVLAEELSRVAGENADDFFVKTILFDFLIANNQRDARQFRIFEVDRNTGYSEQTLKNRYELLIENNFGSAFLSNCTYPLYSIQEYKNFIQEHQLKESAQKFFNRVNPTKITEIIFSAQGVLPEFKEEAVKIFQKQFEKFAELEEFVNTKL